MQVCVCVCVFVCVRACVHACVRACMHVCVAKRNSTAHRPAMFQDSVGELLLHGPPLVYLDVSGNYLGKDYFSRCVGQALKTNTTLQTLR